MRDIWNPWHGCVKKSEGCENCYMYFLDSKRDKSGSEIYRVRNNFDYPLHKDKFGNYKIKSGEFLRVCMTSDFFLKEADDWRDEAWEIMKKRSDVVFILITKRPERVLKCLPGEWDNFENIWFHITCENQKRMNERLPYLLELPFEHKGIMTAPFISRVSLKKALELYLKTNNFAQDSNFSTSYLKQFLKSKGIENIWCGGENYDGARPLFYDWVKDLSIEAREFDISFKFFETGNIYIKNNKKIIPENKFIQSKIAYEENLNYKSSTPQVFKIPKYAQNSQTKLFDLIDDEKFFKKHCTYCSQKEYCAGCSNCAKCGI